MMSKNNNEERNANMWKTIVDKTRQVFVLHVKRKPEIQALL